MGKQFLLIVIFVLIWKSLFAQQWNLISEEQNFKITWQDNLLSFDDGEKKIVESFNFESDIKNVKSIFSRCPLGTYEAIEIEFENENYCRFFFLPETPFLACQSVYRNRGEQTEIIKEIVPVKFKFKKVYDKTFSVEGLAPISDSKEVYQFLSFINSKETLLCGWLTNIHGSGILKSELSPENIFLIPRTEYGTLRIPPGGTVEGEIFVIGKFNDPHLAHETYADAMANYHQIKLNPIPEGGHCTWRAAVNGKSGTEEGTRELAEYCSQNLVDYGFELIQLDDGWQNGPDRKHLQKWRPRNDFSTHRIDGPYPNGMKKTADVIISNKMVAGLWLMPFAWDANCELLKNQQYLFAKDSLGNVRNVEWAGECLDMTNPQTKEFVFQSLKRVTKLWGYKYIKIDALFTGLAADHIYTSFPHYTNDNLGKTIFYDPTKTAIDAFREGLKNVRNAVGPETYILGCNLAQNYRMLGSAIGLVDGMRVGPDVTTNWESLMKGLQMPTRLYFLHNKVWHNDPDHLMLRKPLSYIQARTMANWVAISGQLNLCGEHIPTIGDERVNLYKRSIPNTGLVGKPIDLFENIQAQIWYMQVKKIFANLYSVGMFNWSEDKECNLILNLKDLGLQHGENYLAFDFWDQELKEIKNDQIKMKLEACDSHVMLIREAKKRPMYIGSTRHIVQGTVDLIDEEWFPEENKLKITCQITANDPYKMYVYLPEKERFKLKNIFVNGEKTDRCQCDENICTVEYVKQENGVVSFELYF
jgi:hypothetical protein